MASPKPYGFYKAGGLVLRAGLILRETGLWLKKPRSPSQHWPLEQQATAHVCNGREPWQTSCFEGAATDN